MKSTVRHALVVACIIDAMAFTGAARATNGYQLIGTGSYQKSLAGAVTAAPGSAMTAVSNPAGMARLEDRADFSMEAFMPFRSVDYSALGGEKVDSDVTLYGVPSLGWKGPVGESGKLWFGGGMYGTSGLGVDYPQTQLTPAMGGVLWDGYSSIAFWQMAPALAWRATDKLDLGISLNIDYQQVAFQQRTQDSAGTTTSNFDLSKGAQGFGIGFTVGALYAVNNRLTLGISYKSKQVFSDLEYNLATGDIDPGGSPLPAGRYALDLDYPQQLATGLAYQLNDRLTLSADLKWINWADTMDKLTVSGPGGIAVPMDPKWDDQTVFAVGVQWALSDTWNLRAGYNYAKSPISQAYVQRNLILPAVVEQHFTVGGDVKLDKRWDFGFHFMFVPEKTMKVTATSDPNMAVVPTGATTSMYQISVGANLGYRF